MANGYGCASRPYILAMKFPPIIEGVDTRQRDVDGAVALVRHPILTREYLAALLGITDTTRYRKRLNLLTAPGYTDERVQWPFYRPDEQKTCEGFYRYRKRLLSITHYGREYLDDLGLPSISYGPKGEHFLHKLMRSTGTASLRIAAREHGWQNIYLDQIIAREKCPETTRLSPNPLRVPLDGDHFIELDEIVSFYTGRVYRTHPFEAERGTKDIVDRTKHKKIHRESFEKKLHGYDTLYQRQLYSHWGINSLAPALWLASTPGKAESMLYTLKTAPGIIHRDMHYITWLPGFQTKGWQIPDIHRDLFTDPWQSVNGPIFINQ